MSVADVPWEDVQKVFRTRGDPSSCQCQFFKLTNERWRTTRTDGRRASLQEQIRVSDPPPGLIAYVDGEPVGWCAVEPRPNYARLARTKAVVDGRTEDLDDPSVWAVTCFVVRTDFRRQGIAGVLLNGAVDQARSLGARAIEGYPVDIAERPKASSSELFHGSLSTFVGAGFEVVSRPSTGRAVARMEL
jgi:GNAT superfamily N-acetyltransferase